MRTSWGKATAVGLLQATLLVPIAAAQNPVYPAGPPWRPVPSGEFNGRDLRQELRNKTTDTFTVASVGDMFWKTPVAKRMSAQFRDLLRNADITIGNLEGGVGYDPDLTASAMAELGFNDESNSIAYIANTAYQDGKLVEIRIYPVDIGLGARPWSRENVPMTPMPEKARSILERIQKYSEPFGTKIGIENNIGVIRVPPEATVDVGGELDIPGRRPNGQQSN